MTPMFLSFMVAFVSSFVFAWFVPVPVAVVLGIIFGCLAPILFGV